ncbi:MAG: hypothetical protein CMO10_04245 [Thalassospira sp.]|nr:hypothetical protein [Thalassospira sp.]
MINLPSTDPQKTASCDHADWLGMLARVLVVAMLMLVGVSNMAIAQNRSDALVVKLPMDVGSDYCQRKVAWDQYSEYHVDLLRLAARLSSEDITITPICMDYPTEERRIPMLQAGKEINTVFFGTNAKREEVLLPAYVPIYLGTTGVRLFMTREDMLDDLSDVQSVEDLQKFSMGQGLGWPDNAILEDNGFSVAVGRYATLHRMLAANRFDLYPRAYWQIHAEWNWMKEQAKGIVIAPEIALYYPQPIYFFFSPNEPRLRDAIEAGLKRAYSNGLLFDLLKTNWETAPSFQNIKLRDIRVFRIRNDKITPQSTEALRQYGIYD